MFKEVHVTEDMQKGCSSGPNGHRVFLSLGSNLGDPGANLKRGVLAVGELSGVRIIRCSSVYRTEPQGVRNQPWFANQVVEVCCVPGWTPEKLLQALLDIEQSMGRTRDIRWGPRTIDIDILMFDNQTRDSETLQLPHPRMHNRAFVLVPLAEIAPDLCPVPGREAVVQLLSQISYHVQGELIIQQE